MAMLGKEVRMSRLVNPESKKMMAITVDHAISRGIAPMKGLQPIQETIEKIVMGRPDAMTMTKGIAEHCMWPFAGKVALLMKVSNYSPVSPTRDTIFGSVDEAVRMGADAVSMGAMTWGISRENSLLPSADFPRSVWQRECRLSVMCIPRENRFRRTSRPPGRI